MTTGCTAKLGQFVPTQCQQDNTSTYSPAGLIVVQVHKAATLLPGPSTVVLLPLSDVHKSLSEPATHVVPIFTKT